MRTYRFRAHSLYDADRYRDKAEIQQWEQKDPIPRLFDELREAGHLTDGALTALEDEADTEIDAAITSAEAAPFEPVEELTRYVYTERP